MNAHTHTTIPCKDSYLHTLYTHTYLPVHPYLDTPNTKAHTCSTHYTRRYILTSNILHIPYTRTLLNRLRDPRTGMATEVCEGTLRGARRCTPTTWAPPPSTTIDRTVGRRTDTRVTTSHRSGRPQRRVGGAKRRTSTAVAPASIGGWVRARSSAR